FVAVAPFPAARQPGNRLPTACRHDDQRLIEGALGDGVRRQAATRVRVEVPGKGGVARSSHDEATMACADGASPLAGGGGRRAHDRRQCGATRADGHCDRTGRTETASHPFSFLAQEGACSRMSGNVSGTVTRSYWLIQHFPPKNPANCATELPERS